MYMYMYMCCFALFVCLTLLASFFLPSHLSFKNMYLRLQCITYMYNSTIVDVDRYQIEWNLKVKVKFQFSLSSSIQQKYHSYPHLESTTVLSAIVL